MTTAAWLLILLVIAALVGPFLALKAVSRIRARRSASRTQPSLTRPDDDSSDEI